MVSDDDLKSWRDAAVAGGMPSPLRSDRWQPLRAGVVNLWEFEIAEYWYAGGWVQLTGQNETGKSSLMALTTLIPWLGDTSSANIDTLGRTGKQFRYYVEPSGQPGDRRNRDASTNQGWLWVEYGRQTTDGDEFFTSLLFARAQAAGAQVSLDWCTLAGSARVRGGCELASSRQVIAAKDVVAQGFTVHRTAGAYKAEVAARLLGSTVERLESVGRMLKVTRTPKLGAQLQVNFIQEHLRDALPELDRSEINQLADGWDQLDAIRVDLERSSEAVGIVERFASSAWRPWVRARLRQSADIAATARSRFDRVTRDERAAEDALATALASEDEVRRRSEQAERDQATTEAARDELLASTRYLDAHARLDNLERARQGADNASREAQRAEGAHARAVDAEQEARAATADARRTLGERAETLDRRGGDVRTAAKEAGLPREEDDVVRLRQLAGERRATIRSARVRLRDAEEKAQGAESSEEVAARTRDVADKARRAAEATWMQAEAARDACSSAVLGWASGLRWPAAPDAWVEGLPVRAGDGRPLRERIRDDWYEPLRAGVEREASRARGAQRAAEDDMRATLAEIDDLRATSTTPPGAPSLWARRDRGGPGAALWQVVNPRDGLPPDELASVEAALAASGLLDAWVSDEGLVAADTFVRPDRCVPRGLDTILAAAPGPHEGLVAEFLGGVHLTWAEEELPSDGLAISLDGRWRNSGMLGRAVPIHGQAEWLGEEARRAQRERRIAELERLAEGWRAVADEAAGRVRAAETEMVDLRAALMGGPTDDELRSLLTAAATLDAAADDRAAEAEGDEATARAKRVTADRVRADLMDYLAEHALPVTHDQLDAVDDAVQALDRALTAHASARKDRDRAADELGRSEQRLAGRVASLAEATAHLAERQSALDEAAAKVAALEATLGADDAAVLDEVRRLRERAEALKGDLKALNEQLRTLGITRGQAEVALDNAGRDRGEATRARDNAYAEFRRLIDAGLADEVPVVLPEVESSGVRQVRDQVAVVRDKVSVRGWSDDEAEGSRLVARSRDALTAAAHEARSHLEPGGRSMTIETRDDLPRVLVVVDANGSALPLAAALDRLRAIHAELSATYDERVSETLDQLLGSTFLEHLREKVGRTKTLVGSINEVLARHATKTDRTALRISLDPHEATRGVLAAIDSSRLVDPEVESQVRAFLRDRVDEAKRAAAEAGDGDWRAGLAKQLDYRTWYDINLKERRGSGAWSALTTAGFAKMSGGARAVMLMMPLVATLAALYENMPGTPRPLWLDEAFDGLDLDNRSMVMGLFQEFDLDVLLAGPGRLVNVASVPVSSIYQVVRAPEPEPGVDLMLELWAGGTLESVDLPLSFDAPVVREVEGQDALL